MYLVGQFKAERKMINIENEKKEKASSKLCAVEFSERTVLSFYVMLAYMQQTMHAYGFLV